METVYHLAHSIFVDVNQRNRSKGSLWSLQLHVQVLVGSAHHKLPKTTNLSIRHFQINLAVPTRTNLKDVLAKLDLSLIDGISLTPLDALQVARLVERRRLGGRSVEQKFGHWLVIHLAQRQFDLERQTLTDDPKMQLGRQSSTTSADTSVSSPFFGRQPAGGHAHPSDDPKYRSSANGRRPVAVDQPKLNRIASR